MCGPPTGDLHPIYNAPMLGAHRVQGTRHKVSGPLTRDVRQKMQLTRPS